MVIQPGGSGRMRGVKHDRNRGESPTEQVHISLDAHGNCLLGNDESLTESQVSVGRKIKYTQWGLVPLTRLKIPSQNNVQLCYTD